MGRKRAIETILDERSESKLWGFCEKSANHVKSRTQENPLRPRSERVFTVGLTGFEPATTWRALRFPQLCSMPPKTT